MKNYSYLSLRFIEMIIGVSITACGLSCMIKSNLGLSGISTLTQNITMITKMKSGTVIIFFFLSCTILQILILRKHFEKIQVLQVLIAFVQGMIVNLICYEIPIVSSFYPRTYIGQWIFVLIGIFLLSYGVAVLYKAEFIRNPLEELAMVLANLWQIEFSVFRVRIDMFFIAMSLLLILVFQLDFTTLREGTWVSMFMLGRSMNYTFPLAEKTSLYRRRKYYLQTYSN